MTFPAPVPEIPADNVDKAVAYYVNTLGFASDWGGDQDGIAGISRGNCRLFITNRAFRESYGNIGLFFSGSISTVRRRWTNCSHSGRPRKRRSFPNQRINRGSCASLWPLILMATSFASFMISGVTCSRTTLRAKLATSK